MFALNIGASGVAYLQMDLLKRKRLRNACPGSSETQASITRIPLSISTICIEIKRHLIQRAKCTRPAVKCNALYNQRAELSRIL